MKDLFTIFMVLFLGYAILTTNAKQNVVEEIPEKIDSTKEVKTEKTIVDKDKMSDKFITHVTLTSYQPVPSQCNADCLHTADNSKIDLKKLKEGKLKWVAISQDLLYKIPMGSKVKISNEETGECYGTFLVKDKMNKRWEHRMDVLVHPSTKMKDMLYGKNIRVELV